MKQSRDNKAVSKVSIFCSILVAIYISIPILNQILVASFPGLAGRAMTLLYALTIVGVLIMGWMSVFSGVRVDLKLFLYICAIIFTYLLTCLFAPYTRLNIFDFISYTIVAMIIPLFLKIDVKYFLRVTMLCSTPAFFFMDRIFIYSKLHHNITMGVSYAFLPSIIASIVYLFLYIKCDNKKRKIFYGISIVINLLFFFQVLQYGSRGPLLCIGACICFLLCFKYKKNRIEVVAIKFIIFACIMLLMILNVWTTLELIQSFLSAYDIEIDAIDKLFRLMASSNDITNGRSAITKEVMNGIFESPIWGHGLSTTKHNLNIVYPHNFILQLFYDGGVFLAFPILFSMIYGIIRIFRSCTFDEYAFVCALFFMSVPGALFSGDLWESNRLWLTIAVLIMGDKIRKFIS